LRICAAARVVDGKKVHANVKNAMIVPGSGLVKEHAEVEGLDKIFLKAGFEWREPGCSMCIAMNPDKLAPGERCVSTSNRNFEGRQGYKGRTHLVSPAMAALLRLPAVSSTCTSGIEASLGYLLLSHRHRRVIRRARQRDHPTSSRIVCRPTSQAKAHCPWRHGRSSPSPSR
jgi:hypothetical protein